MVQKVDLIGEEVHDIKSSVDDLKAMMSQVDQNASIASSAQMPVPPTIFVGRDEVVNKIAGHLVSGDIARSRVFILAPGGMGKTSTALVRWTRTARFHALVSGRLMGT